MKKINKKNLILRLTISFIIIGILLLSMYLIFKKLGFTDMSKEQLQEKIASYGAWGPIAFIVVSFLQVTFIPIPSVVTIIAGNYLFGFFLSFLYSFIGIILGSMLAFFLGRKIGRPFVNWIVGDKETVDYYLNKFKGKETIILFFMFLLPVFPDDALCAVAGIMPINFIIFLGMQIFTRITSIGATLIFMSGELIPYHGWGIVVLFLIGILSIITFIFAIKNSDKINDKLVSFVEKVFHKKNDKKNIKLNEKSVYNTEISKEKTKDLE